MLCWKLVYLRARSEYGKRDNTEEATTNLWACGKFSVKGGAHKLISFFLCHVKTAELGFQQMHLSCKIQANFLMYTSK